MEFDILKIHTHIFVRAGDILKVEWFSFELDHENIYSTLGCSPNLIRKFRKWILPKKGKIESLDLCLYLFNNEVLYNLLKELATYDCKVTVYSIPLEGYDNNHPMPLISHKNGKNIGNKTKYDLAVSLYNKIKEDASSNFHLRIVPHMYLRSELVEPFSRGKMPYSLHCKSFLLKMRSGTTYEGVTSSNFAVRDKEKHELAAVFQLEGKEITATADFYSGLYENSIPFSDFDASKDYTHFEISMRTQPAKALTMHIAPFYKNSASAFEEHITTIIKNAKNNIYICAQHISAYKYTYKNEFTAPGAPCGSVREDGFLSAVLEKANSGVPVKFLSQTYVDEFGNNNGHLSPANTRNFSKFIAAARNSNNCKYFVNKNVHCKFIVADDIVLITTCNFTPTQFIYLENVSIPQFSKMHGLSYTGIHCEFGAYFVIKNHRFARSIIRYFDKMVDETDTSEEF